LFFSDLKVPSTYYLVDTYKKLAWVQRELLASKAMAFDIETNHPTTNSDDRVKEWRASDARELICGVSYAWGRTQVESPWQPGTAAYIPLTRPDDTPYWGKRQDAVHRVIEEIQVSPIPKAAQNGKFDCTKFRQLLGIKTEAFAFDTMLAHALVDEDCLVSRHALKSKFSNEGEITGIGLSDAYLDLGTSEFKRDLDDALKHYDPALKRYSCVPLDILHPYGCADSDMVLSLMFVMQKLLDAEGLTWNFQNIMMPLQHRLMLMEMHGVPLDIARAKYVEAEQTQILEALTVEVQQLTGHVFNVGAPQQLGKVLFEDLQLPGGRKNKMGWVVDAEVLEALDHPAKEPLQKYRRADQIRGTYATASLERVAEITHGGTLGWIHTDYFMPSKTGRLRSRLPNLSQLPKSDKGGDIVKGMYACPEDYRFVFADESQIELRVTAHLSQEPVWLEGFNQGHDMHSATAHAVYNLPCTIEEVKALYYEKRSDAKTINFGILYGRTAHALSKQLNISEEEAWNLINVTYFGAAPTLKQWIDDTHAFAEQEGYVNTIFNRRRHLPDAQTQDIQGLPWPDLSVRPTCYRDGPYLKFLDIKFEDIYDMQAYQIKEQIKSRGSQFNKCMGCPFVRSCIVNRERKYLASKKAEAMRQAVNSPVQGSAVEMVSLCATWIGDELERQGLDSRPVLHIHDEIGCYTHVSCVDQTLAIMKYFMTDYLRQYTQFSVPLLVDTKVSRRWGEK